jgi:hypothetical protein
MSLTAVRDTISFRIALVNRKACCPLEKATSVSRGPFYLSGIRGGISISGLFNPRYRQAIPRVASTPHIEVPTAKISSW